jgi:hypothetical protein
MVTIMVKNMVTIMVKNMVNDGADEEESIR